MQDLSTASQSTAPSLEKLLADSYTLYLKTHNFHWNVTGPAFLSLHQLFETQYTELSTAVDEIAERIRTLGRPAPGSYQEFAELSTVQEALGAGEKISAKDMIAQLATDQIIVANTAGQVIREASEAGDDATADLATQRQQIHQKAAWMLNSLLA